MSDEVSPLLGDLKKDDPFYRLLLEMSATVRAPEATPFWAGVARALATNVPWLIEEIRRLRGLVGERPAAPKALASGWGVLVAPDELLVASDPDVGSGPVLFESEGEAINEARLRPEPCRVVQVQVVEVPS